jgi:nitrate/nitrite-specific signal transduction histidine kinase
MPGAVWPDSHRPARPTAAHQGHFGIVRMREQAQLTGTELSFRSLANQGTAVRLVFGTRPQIEF